MKNDLKKCFPLVIIFLVLAGIAFGVNYYVNTLGMQVSMRIHFLFFFLHLISLCTILAISVFKKDLVGYIFMAFLILKMGAMILVVYKFPMFKENLLWYFGLYWYYLFIETALVVVRIKGQDKNHKINK